MPIKSKKYLAHRENILPREESESVEGGEEFTTTKNDPENKENVPHQAESRAAFSKGPFDIFPQPHLKTSAKKRRTAMAQVSFRDRTISTSKSCVICCHESEFFSFGPCNHPVCYECAIRIRVICESQECPICREKLTDIIIVKDPGESYQSLVNAVQFVKSKSGDQHRIQFQSEDIRSAFDDLLANVCTVCRNQPDFKTFNDLKNHMKREHQVYYCDLCVEHLKLFSWERKCYNRQDLARHRREGDADDRSHRGHPNCTFCENRFLDKDHLYVHLRRDHFLCNFCEVDNGSATTVFYDTYRELRDHFQQSHFLCEEGDCRYERFTSAFRTEIDLKGHKATVHKNKDRLVNLEWGHNYDLPAAPSGRGRGGRGRGRYGRDEDRRGGPPRSAYQRRNPNQETTDDDVEYVVVDSSAGSKVNTVVKINRDNRRRSPDEGASGTSSSYSFRGSDSGRGRGRGPEVKPSPRSEPAVSEPKSPEFQSQDFPSLGPRGGGGRGRGGAFSSDGFNNFAGWMGRGGMPPGALANQADFPSLERALPEGVDPYNPPKLTAQMTKEEVNDGKRPGMVMIDDDEDFPTLQPTATVPTSSEEGSSSSGRKPKPEEKRKPDQKPTPAASSAKPEPYQPAEPPKQSLYESISSSAWKHSKPPSLGQVSSILGVESEFPSLAPTKGKLKGLRQTNPTTKSNVKSAWKQDNPTVVPASMSVKIATPRNAKALPPKKAAVDDTKWVKLPAKKSEVLQEEERRKEKEKTGQEEGQFVKVGSGAKSKQRRVAKQAPSSSETENQFATLSLVTENQKREMEKAAREEAAVTSSEMSESNKKPSLYESLMTHPKSGNNKLSLNNVSSVLSRDEDFPSLGSGKGKLKNQRQAKGNSASASNSAWSISSDGRSSKSPPKATATSTDANQNEENEGDLQSWMAVSAQKAGKPRQLADRNQKADFSSSDHEDMDSDKSLKMGALNQLIPNNPPPGFGSKKPAPPPGFSSKAPVLQPRPGERADFAAIGSQVLSHDPPPPPGFSSIRAAESTLLAAMPYHRPVDFEKRNQVLFSKLSRALSPKELTDFKEFSRMYRRKEMNADLYASSVRDLLGFDLFGEVIPELLCLLPDIELQRTLHQTLVQRGMIGTTGAIKPKHSRGRGSKSSAWSGSAKPGRGSEEETGTFDGQFWLCGLCGQVTSHWDQGEHSDSHAVNEEFPALGRK